MGVGVIGGTSQLEGIYNAVTNAPKPAILDPMLQPAFYVASSAIQPSGIFIYNHYLQMIGTTSQINESYSPNTYTGTYGSELSDNFGYNGGQPSTSNGYFTTSGIGHSNYFGSRYFEVASSPSSNGDFVVHNRGNAGAHVNYSGWMFLGNIVSDSSSNAHKVSIGLDSSQIVISEPSSKMFGQAFALTPGNSKKRASVSTLLSGLSYEATVQGAISYNATTRRLAILIRTGYSHYPVIFDDVDHPAGYLGRTDAWISHIATKTRYANTSSAAYKPANGSSEDQGRAQIGLTDTGRLFHYTQIYNWGASGSYWDLSGGAISSNTSLFGTSWTNVYGIGNDTTWGGGSQNNVTNDTNTLFLYSHAYYYHGGMQGILIDVKTGRAIHNYYWQTDTIASISPVGKSEFIMGQSVNSDSGIGMQAKLFNFNDEYFRLSGGNGTTNSLHNANTSPFSGSNVSWIDSRYHSTNYPAIYPIQGYDKALVGGQK